MKIKSLTVGDITSQNLLYYEASCEKECLGICDYLNIDLLPLIGQSKYAERDGNKFIVKPIGENVCISPFVSILDNQFRRRLNSAMHNVVFVVDGKITKGVVHISDLNRNEIIHAIQQDYLLFERNLRHLLQLNDLTNKDVLDFMASRSQKVSNKEYWKGQYDSYSSLLKRKNIEHRSDLQLFNLSHLLEFGNSELGRYVFPISSAEEKKAITDLRNKVMHAKDSIDLSNSYELQTAKQLNNFFKNLEIFIKYYELAEEKINSHTKHCRAIILDNASKLKIIGDHYPNAIEYFIR
jgi:hypothetical protein